MTEPTIKQVELQDGASADIVEENVQQLKKLFPDAFTENGVNFDTLRQLLGDLKVLDEGEEKYGLNWHGKKQARQIALTPSLGTLLPCPEESVDWDTTQNLFIEGDNLEVLKPMYSSKTPPSVMMPPKQTWPPDKSFVGDIAESFVRFLLQRCFLVAVSTPNQQSAFRVFSVMNSRGLDLQPTDIIKADIIGKIPEKSQENYNNRWEQMEIELGRAGFNDLFSFIRMIYAKEKAKKAIIDEFRHYVLSEIKDPQKFLEDVLEPYAAALMTIKKADYQAAENAQEVNIYLRWLNRIDNSDWIPVAILFVAKRWTRFWLIAVPSMKFRYAQTRR